MATPEQEDNHPLQNEWCAVIWEHQMTKQSADWGDNMQQLGTVNSVESFWKYFNNIPKPSQVMSDKTLGRRKVGGREIESYSVFKQGILPKWEDPANQPGGEWQLRMRGNSISIQQVDRMWENVVLGMIGETVCAGDEICGARIVDKSRGGPQYRLELWIRSRDESTTARVREGLMGAVSDGVPQVQSQLEVTFKSH
ncbi:unnamed protein product [Chrysoparadoxa australica]